MVASDKIEEAKNCFGSITKSGRNNYQKYDYLEVKDIFPTVREVCKKYNLKTSIKPDLKEERFVLRITDRDDNSYEDFYVPLFLNKSGDVGKQYRDYGSSQTYAQRYLYIQAFEIAVPDEIDNKNQMVTKSNQQKIINKKNASNKAPKKTQYSPVQPVQEQQDNDGEVTAEHIQDIIKQAEKKFHEAQLHKLEKDRQPFTWGTAKEYIRELCRTEQEYQICKQSTTFKTADKVKGAL